jgi:hypothetical protein
MCLTAVPNCLCLAPLYLRPKRAFQIPPDLSSNVKLYLEKENKRNMPPVADIGYA